MTDDDIPIGKLAAALGPDDFSLALAAIVEGALARSQGVEENPHDEGLRPFWQWGHDVAGALLKQADDDEVVIVSNACPECGNAQTRVYFIGPQCWGACRKCRVKWWWGLGAIPGWERESPGDQIASELLLHDYRVVDDDQDTA